MAAVKRMTAASAKVAAARAKQMEIEAAMLEAKKEQAERDFQVKGVQQQAQTRIADAEVLAAERMLKEAELQAKLLQREKQAMLAELNQDAERQQSGKAAATAAAGGLVGALPAAFTLDQEVVPLLLTLAGSTATCLLFGVVYRYVVAADESNSQLKGGAVAAFGLARGIALAESIVSSNANMNLDVLASAALAAGQSMLAVGFAAAALELAMAKGVVMKFGDATAESSS